LRKNKFGQIPRDISKNLETKLAFDNLMSSFVDVLDEPGAGRMSEISSQYGRTAFNGVLMHNDRVNMVHKLMAKS
jgi:hypothetical protein